MSSASFYLSVMIGVRKHEVTSTTDAILGVSLYFFETTGVSLEFLSTIPFYMCTLHAKPAC